MALGKWLLCAILVASATMFSEGSTTGYQQLVTGIRNASKLAQGCSTSKCLGAPVTVTLNEDVLLTGPLPPLAFYANLIVKGACPKKRCVIDGGKKYSVFTSNFTSGQAPNTSLALSDLVVQGAARGVFNNVWATIRATRVLFQGNDGVVLRTAEAFGGWPTVYFTSCDFIANTNTPISAGNGKNGLGNAAFAYVVTGGGFYRNVGGAANLVGSGVSVFESVVFDSNTAGGSGGAVYAYATSVIFRNTTFSRNQAVTGVGGAVAGYSGYYHGLSVSFCSSTFAANTAPKYPTTASLSFAPDAGLSTQIQVAFCNTPQPVGSVLPKKPYGSVFTGTGSQCAKTYC